MPEPRRRADDPRHRRPGESPFEYAIVRVIPRVERGEALQRRHRADVPAAAVPGRLDRTSTRRVLGAIAPDCDPEIVRTHLAAIEADRRRRPRTRVPSPRSRPRSGSTGSSRRRARSSSRREVHTGLTADPAATLEHLFRTLVRR